MDKRDKSTIIAPFPQNFRVRAAMLLLLPGGSIRPAMSRRKPDARNPKRPSSHSSAHGGKGGNDRRDQRREGGPEGRSRPDKQGKSGKFAHGSDRAAAGKGPKRPDQGRRTDRRDDQRSDQKGGRGFERGPERGSGREPGRDFRPRSGPAHGRELPTWLYGSHACLAALHNPERYHRRLLLTREAREALGGDLPANPQPETVDRARLDALLPPGAVHQGIALLTDPLEDPGVESLKEPLDEAGDVVLVLDHVTDPRNVGAILRSAAAFGARAVIITDRHAPEATGALAKAASGGLEVVPLIRVTNLARALDLLAEYGFWRIGLEMETEKTLADVVAGVRRKALVLGAEDEGLRRLTREKCDFLAKLPMSGAVESLNVSAAAAVALYEAVRDGAGAKDSL
ncbi:23S rRNA (guanosine(2251)-2'-O)-methyltransferase RlmB [Ferrovibrio sp.]|uniref:23S rRNA (guanosine(2251)-2'-O)-methyltransferase RlmB n=1 Tax=Ferrovibrio sp. TaxID=1917215 RepID=UPI0035AF6D05